MKKTMAVGIALVAAVVILGAVIAAPGLHTSTTTSATSGQQSAYSSATASASTTLTTTSLSSSATPTSTPSTSTTSSTSSTIFILPLSCHSTGGLPDPACTPGATNPNVTQANIQSTICVSGYTDTIRPSTSYTDPLKKTSIQLYGYSDTNMSDYEEDHLIALEIGGSPTSVANLWAEPHYGTYTSLQKDQFENYLHTQVCSGKVTLAVAQNEIATNWAQYWLASGGVTSSSSTTTSSSSATVSISSTTTSSATGQIAATISYGSDPIVRGNTQIITVTVTDLSSPLAGASVSVHVTYASQTTTKDLPPCTTSTSGSCSVSLQIGGSSDAGTFAVRVVVDGVTFNSSFQVTTA